MQIVIGIIGLGVIVFIHELGHFLAAKYYKVEVVEFAIGMGPKLFSHLWGETTYSIRLLPLGGFCKMKSEHESGFHYKKEYANMVIPQTEGTLFMLPIFQKAVVLLAGPGANVLWYALMSLILFATGYQTEVLSPRIEPIKNKSAYESGLLAGDTITRFNGVEIRSFSQLAHVASKNIGRKVRMEYIRAGSLYAKDVQLDTTAPVLGVYPFVDTVITSTQKTKGSFTQVFRPNDVILSIDDVEIYNAIRIYDELKKHAGSFVSVTVQRGEEKISQPVFVSHVNPEKAWGITFPKTRMKQWSNFGEFVRTRIAQVKTMTVSTLKIIVRFFTFQKTDKNADVAGPIRIISLVGDNTLHAVKTQGIAYALWQFINISALLSFAVALMNMIPIPVLDGGQLMFYTFHALFRRQPRYKTLVLFQSVGVAIMLFLFIFVMFKDIAALI